jgi:hypothetical protein
MINGGKWRLMINVKERREGRREMKGREEGREQERKAANSVIPLHTVNLDWVRYQMTNPWQESTAGLAPQHLSLNALAIGLLVMFTSHLTCLLSYKMGIKGSPLLAPT